jgi:HPt (histidine-containing phosphotransfer) domain-containing protein
MIDIEQLSARLGNNKAIVEKIMGIFITQYDTGQPVFESGMASKDTEEIYHLAHSLKGALANMCAEEDAAAAAEIEMIARGGDVPDSALISAMEQRVQDINSQIKDYTG